MRRLLAVILVTVLTLGLAELVLRVAYPVDYRRPQNPASSDAFMGLIHQPSNVPGLDYEIMPNTAGLAVATGQGINALGFRGPAPGPRTENSRRIAVLGDSFTYGLGVRADQTYPSRLQEILRGAPGDLRFDVLNLGVTAYGTRDAAIALEAKAWPLEPDLILLGYVLNDPETIGYQPIRNYYAPVQWWQRFNLTRLVMKARADWFVRTRGEGDYVRSLYADAEKWSAVVHGFQEIAAQTSAREVPAVIVLFPMIPVDTWDEYAYMDLHERVSAEASRAGLRVLDLTETLERHEPMVLRMSRDDWHPGPRGYQIAARAIAEYLWEEGLLQ